MSYPSLLARGLAAGGLAGLASGLVGLLVVEPSIRGALAIEEAHETGGHTEMFSRPVQVAGGVAAAVLFGLAVGAVFATVLARRPVTFRRSVIAAATGFAVVAALPAVKYPANPPGVGDPDTVNRRTALYLTLIAAGLAIAYGTRRLDTVLAARTAWSAPWRVTAVTGAAVAAVVVVLVVWPAGPDAVPADVGASLLWRFRLASLAELATLWGVLGFAFGLFIQGNPRYAPTRGASIRQAPTA